MDPLPKKNLKMRHWVGYAAVSRAQGPQSASYRPSVFAHANDRRELTKKKKKTKTLKTDMERSHNCIGPMRVLIVFLLKSIYSRRKTRYF